MSAARVTAGRAARKRTPLDRHGVFQPPADRPDPVDIVLAQEKDRIPELLNLRHERMRASPLAFYRGAAAVMAADLVTQPGSGLVTQLCGDAHLYNFGLFASPERRLVFDLNDFDETWPGPFEWDVKRLLASVALAGRANGFGRRDRAVILLRAARRYRETMAAFAGMSELDVWYARADVDDLVERLDHDRRRKVLQVGAKARGRTGLQAYRKLTTVVDGRRGIAADPPLLVPVSDLLPELDRLQLEDRIRALLAGYRSTLAEDRRHLFDAFRYVDMARKVVGVGSVGTRCWIVLLTARDDTDPLLLQVKEAGPSVLATATVWAAAGPAPGLAAGTDGEGHRVVAGQRLMQATSDIFLGWHRVPGIDGRTRDFYVRQLRDWKGSVPTEEMNPRGLRAYAELCSWTLARAHARSGDRVAIAAYLGDSDRFDRALAEFAESYATRSELDHIAFRAATKP
ncbi:DUF2252 domain-containing protein [Actinoplanes regularis]|uniref:Uncharacterized conserved protein, DUF2252 family n=1 Tax=Actinoplanes regularis TaxID=52697 RepID=A0A239HUS9_9ACTN|nr:DUF2252 domain-containing protein [Actinoplanes regularis]SNS85059.1 Uncharacterized conserved protein, DUF2252 family [Actinoplanes regularis]